ncbi:DNA ligase [Vibrio casei]|uniref:DNA ligase n=1 Tax=Vibrio casei TaxID=673372 RepID=A0A368LN56_9VIBR|nr:DNA ligase [Vibrio casei]RCS73268.1 DNA ligase [Vibrio casei]SJN18413.1 DNA ligase (ATP) [Vibrio casei]
MHVKKISPSILVAGLTLTTITAASETRLKPDVVASSSSSILLPLANEFKDNISLQDYWYSEKYDGIRAYWNGDMFYTRQGKPIVAPHWFIESMPSIALDGELWAGRGQFNHVQKTVLDTKPNTEDWKNIQFMVFDLASSRERYATRYMDLKSLLHGMKSINIQLVKQYPISSHSELDKVLDTIEHSNGEGIMLRNIHSFFLSGRSDDLLKVKSYEDDEAIVIGYKSGNGKYKGKVGSLWVKWKEGKTFYLGSGLSDQLREDPPALGSVVNFRFNGLTHTGLPRFARFTKQRTDI